MMDPMPMPEPEPEPVPEAGCPVLHDCWSMPAGQEGAACRQTCRIGVDDAGQRVFNDLLICGSTQGCGAELTDRECLVANCGQAVTECFGDNMIPEPDPGPGPGSSLAGPRSGPDPVPVDPPVGDTQSLVPTRLVWPNVKRATTRSKPAMAKSTTQRAAYDAYKACRDQSCTPANPGDLINQSPFHASCPIAV